MTDTPTQPGAGFQRPESAEAAAKAAANMPLPVARADLMISPQLYLGKIVYVVKDPVSLSYFRLQPPEHMVLCNLDGRNTATQLAQMVNGAFPDHETTPEDVMTFVRMLQAGGLLLGRGETYGAWLRQTRATRRRKRGIATAMNFIFIKIPVLDPDGLLDWMYSYAKLLMNPVTMVLSLLFMAASMVALAWNFGAVENLAMPILSWQNGLLLVAVGLVVKVIHEFGHGLAAKHRGLEVHETGVMLMVFLPMFYIDVSDAWILPRRRERLWITAGGVFIEFMFASAAVWVWLFTEPGLVNQIAFNVMLAASVTTLLFNANPLLRYDGYYFLMDWLQIPNLRTKANQFTAYLAKKYLLGMKDLHPPREAATRPIFMPIYAVSSSIYRWLITFGIVLLVYHLLDPAGLENLGVVLAAFVIFTSIVLPAFKTMRFIWSQQAKTFRRLAASAGALGALAAVAWAVSLTPVQESVQRPGVVLAADRQPLYAAADSWIEEIFVRSGQPIEAGQPILRLNDENLRDELAALRLQRRQVELQIANARRDQRIDNVLTGATALSRLDERIARWEKRLGEMVVRAPFSGRFHLPARSLEDSLGMHVKEREQLGMMIGVQPRLKLVIPQEEASRLNLAMKDGPLPVEVRLWADPARTVFGRVELIGSDFVAELPHDHLDARYGGEVETRSFIPSSAAMGADLAREVDRVAGERYKTKPARDSVLATVVLDDPQAVLVDGMTARTHIVTGRSSLGAVAWRELRQLMPLDWRLWGR